MAAALEGIKVLDLTSYIAGPFATMLLGDLGATVIKIENPDEGDPFRTWKKEPRDYSPLFRSFNRNKKSLTLNLRADEGRNIFLELARAADIVVENYRPGVVDRLKIGYNEVKAINPRIIYCSISAFGQTGPYKDRPGYDTIGQGLSGLLSLLTDTKAPTGPGAPFSDHLGGLYGCYGILAALAARERTGRGQKVETSLLESTISFIGYSLVQYLSTGEIPTMVSRLHQAQIYAFVAKDGLPFVIHLSFPQKFWQGLTEVAGHPEWATDDRFKDPDGRMKNYAVIHDLLEKIFVGQDRDYWLAELQEHDVPCAPIRTTAEVFEDPQVAHLAPIEQIDDPSCGIVHIIKNGVRLSETPVGPSTRPPRHGENTEEVLRDIGYGPEAISNLRSKKII
jgi:crotonobetainyl-CoA:carnitine CoA-transferase CaiB-like acyl-CoA transferase